MFGTGEAPAALAETALQFATETADPSRLVDAVRAGIATLDTAALEAPAAQFPDDSLVLADLAAEVTTALVDRLRGSASATETIAPERLARWLNTQSIRLADVGRREDALPAIGEAVATYRELAAARPDAIGPASPGR